MNDVTIARMRRADEMIHNRAVHYANPCVPPKIEAPNSDANVQDLIVPDPTSFVLKNKVCKSLEKMLRDALKETEVRRHADITKSANSAVDEEDDLTERIHQSETDLTVNENNWFGNSRGCESAFHPLGPLIRHSHYRIDKNDGDVNNGGSSILKPHRRMNRPSKKRKRGDDDDDDDDDEENDDDEDDDEDDDFPERPREYLEIVSREWEESYLRPPDDDEKPCSNGEKACCGTTDFPNKMYDWPEDVPGFVLVAFKTPDEKNDSNYNARIDSGLCLPCLRRDVKRLWLIARSSDEKVNSVRIPYRVVVNKPGEHSQYDTSALIPALGASFYGISDPFVYYSINHYAWDENERKIVQRNVGNFNEAPYVPFPLIVNHTNATIVRHKSHDFFARVRYSHSVEIRLRNEEEEEERAGPPLIIHETSFNRMCETYSSKRDDDDKKIRRLMNDVTTAKRFRSSSSSVADVERERYESEYAVARLLCETRSDDEDDGIISPEFIAFHSGMLPDVSVEVTTTPIFEPLAYALHRMNKTHWDVPLTISELLVRCLPFPDVCSTFARRIRGVNAFASIHVAKFCEVVVRATLGGYYDPRYDPRDDEEDAFRNVSTIRRMHLSEHLLLRPTISFFSNFPNLLVFSLRACILHELRNDTTFCETLHRSRWSEFEKHTFDSLRRVREKWDSDYVDEVVGPIDEFLTKNSRRIVKKKESITTTTTIRKNKNAFQHPLWSKELDKMLDVRKISLDGLKRWKWDEMCDVLTSAVKIVGKKTRPNSLPPVVPRDRYKYFDARHAYDGIDAVILHAEIDGNYSKESCEIVRRTFDNDNDVDYLTSLDFDALHEAYLLVRFVSDSFKVRIVRMPHHWYLNLRSVYDVVMGCTQCRTLRGVDAKTKFQFDPQGSRSYCFRKTGKKLEPSLPFSSEKASKIRLASVCDSAACNSTECVPMDLNGNLVEFFGRIVSLCRRCARPVFLPGYYSKGESSKIDVNGTSVSLMNDRCAWTTEQLSCRRCLNSDARAAIPTCEMCDARYKRSLKRPWKRVRVFSRTDGRDSAWFCNMEKVDWMNAYPVWFYPTLREEIEKDHGGSKRNPSSSTTTTTTTTTTITKNKKSAKVL